MYLFDSNILIYHLNAALEPSVQEQIETWIVEGAAISVITQIEVLGFDQPAARATLDARKALTCTTGETVCC